jgi:membrane associated rhomboid family serine protease
MFLHVGVLHLLVNMYSLWIIGPYVEKLYGSAKFVVFWITSGIAGVVASYLTVVQPDRHLGPLARFILKTQDAPSAGASGALFGLVGVLFVFGIKFRHELPEGFKRAFGTGMLPVIVLNLFIGYMAHGLIDNAAHLGGLISGALLAVFVGYRRPGERSGVTIIWHVLQWGAIAFVAVGFIKVTQHLRDPLPSSLFPQTAQSTDDSYGNFVAYAQAMNDAQEALVGIVQGKESNGIDKSLEELDAAPHLDEKSDELKQRLKLMLEKAKALKVDKDPIGRDARSEQRKRHDIITEFDSWTKEYGQWLKTNGKKHGGLIEMENPVPGK